MTQPRNWRAWLAFFHDVCAAALAWVAIYWLRFNLDFRAPDFVDVAWTLAWIVPLQGAIFLAFGLYRGLWRFASLVDLQRIVLAAGLGALLIPLVLVMLRLHAVVPRSVLVVYPVVLIFLMAGDRFAYRIWKEHRLYSPLRRARRAGARDWRGRSGRAAYQGACAQPPLARGRAPRRRPDEAWAPVGQRDGATGRSRACRNGRRNTACAR